MTMQKITTAGCESRLPQPLIDYLWQLAAESEADTHTFVLSAKYTDAGEAQDILHRRNNFSSWRRVFGYPAVEAVVEVCITGQTAVMALADNEPAAARARRKEALPCSA